MRRSGRSLCLLAYTFIAAPKTYCSENKDGENMHAYNVVKNIEMQHLADSPISYTIEQKYSCLTWSQSPSSMVPLIFLKISVN